jgi:asparagine synthase (glutamine-hydrolysing)
MAAVVKRVAQASRTGRAIMRSLGVRWLMRRVAYSAAVKAGVFQRRIPATTWDEQPLEGLLEDRSLAHAAELVAHRRRLAERFFFTPARMAEYRLRFAAWDGPVPAVLTAADRLVEGICPYFSGVEATVGMPPAWHRDPFTGRELPPSVHWSAIDDFAGGDIKVLWEPSRFGWVYTLVRAYWRSGDERYAAAFWRLVESWREANPPQQGVNWKCGQETTFRVMALCFGLHGFLDSAETTPERVARLVQVIAVSARRIAVNLGYALNQQNNHGVSEGVGLWTVGVLFPEIRGARRWRTRGRAILEQVGRELIYEDGGFSQHSLNYQRLMLHDYIWSFRLAEIAGEPFSKDLRDRVYRSADLLWAVMNDETGGVPTSGANDGSLILPLNDAGYDDYRAVVQAGVFATRGERRFNQGTWDEDLLWLFGSSALEAPVQNVPRRSITAPISGYHVLRDGPSRVFIHLPERFRHRPSHADLLHVDLTWRGIDVAIDAGTLSYNSPGEPDAAFDRTRYHNTVTIDDHDQMERASRFLWAPWPLSRVRSTAADLAFWEGEHAGYARLSAKATHRRAVVNVGEDVWVVGDLISSAAPVRSRLHWLLADFPLQTMDPREVRLDTPAGTMTIALWTDDSAATIDVVRAGDDLRGWRSRRYGLREPAHSIALTSMSSPRGRFLTVFAPDSVRVLQRDDGVDISRDGRLTPVRFQFADAQPMLRID